MRSASLIDSGPLVALFHRSDRYHKQAIAFLRGYTGRFVTTWPVITETLYLLSSSASTQSNLLEWIERGSLELRDLDMLDLKYIRTRMRKYADVPMDLADASLMAVSERTSIITIASIDSDFSIYRTSKGKYLGNIFPL